MSARPSSSISFAPNGPASGRSTMRASTIACSGAFSTVKPYQKDGIPVFIAGASDAAIEVAGKHADVFALWGETYDEVRSQLGKVRAASRQEWPRRAALQPVVPADPRRHRRKGMGKGRSAAGAGQGGAGQDRLHTQPAEGCRTKDRGVCWRSRRRAPGSTSGSGPGWPNSPAPAATRRHWSARRIRSPRSLAQYYDLGIDIFLIRGFDPLIDTIEYGRDLIPRTHKLIAERSAAKGVAAE